MENLWLCTAHFIHGKKDDNPFYVPTVFAHTKSLMKRKLTRDMDQFERMSAAKKRREESSDKQAAVASLLQLLCSLGLKSSQGKRSP